MRTRWLLAIVLLAGGNAFAQEAAAPDRIGWGYSAPWGPPWRNVAVESDGKVVITASLDRLVEIPCAPPMPGDEVIACPQPRPTRSPVRTIRFSIGTGGYSEIRRTLGWLEKRAGVRGRCMRPVYDAGSSWVNWKLSGRELRYELGDGCSAAEVRRAGQLAAAAEKRLTELGKSAPDYRSEEH